MYKYNNNNNMYQRISKIVKIYNIQHDSDKQELNNKCIKLKELINSSNKLLDNINLDNKEDIRNYLNRNLELTENKLKEWNTVVQELEADLKNNNMDELKGKIEILTDQLEETKNNYTLLNDKINCCLESLANSLELLTQNSKQNDTIYQDLQKNNALTAKISIEQNKLIKIQDGLNHMITNHTKNNELEQDNFKEALTEILKNKDKLKQIEFKKVEQIIDNDKEINPEKNDKDNKNINNDDKDKMIHSLLNLILDNSKDVIGKLTPQLNLWQRQKIFTTIIKIVDKKIDNVSNLLKDVKLDDNTQDFTSLISNLIDNDNLKISKKDIIDATWNEDSDSDSEDELEPNPQNNEDDFAKNKHELLNNIMDELNKKKEYKVNSN